MTRYITLSVPGLFRISPSIIRSVCTTALKMRLPLTGELDKPHPALHSNQSQWPLLKRLTDTVFHVCFGPVLSRWGRRALHWLLPSPQPLPAARGSTSSPSWMIWSTGHAGWVLPLLSGSAGISCLITFTCRAFSRRFYPKRLTRSTFVRRKRKNNQ